VIIPDLLRRNILDVHGPAGAEWLAQIPERVERCLAQWALSVEAPYANPSYSYVVRVARADGTGAVLKLSFPGEQAVREALALRAFRGRGCVALLAEDASIAAMLLERADPGSQLADLCETDDGRATSIAADVIRKLHTTADMSGFPSVAAWQSDLQRIPAEIELPPLVRALASHAMAVIAELLETPGESRLLHGDLHSFNILSSSGEWLAIDPHGIAGERECEIAPLVINPPALLNAGLIRRRMDQLCDELDLDRSRARAWTFVRAVLAILWSIEDHGEAAQEWIECAGHLR
jgi:streptomycin 6-kinase